MNGMGLYGARIKRCSILWPGCCIFLLCFSSYVFLRFGFEQGAWLSLLVVLAVWASDIGAYFVGKFVGGAEAGTADQPQEDMGRSVRGYGLLRCSPCSSLSGRAFLFTMDGYGFRAVFCPYSCSSFLWVAFWVLWGQGGDLLVSFFKRRGGLKDTGHLIPGHGGLLTVLMRFCWCLLFSY